MKPKSIWFVWVIAIIALAALPAFGCANHQPQKAATETSSSSSQAASGASFSSNTLGGGIKIIQSKKSNSGTRSFTEGFFNSPTPSDGANQYKDDWTSAIP